MCNVGYATQYNTATSTLKSRAFWSKKMVVGVGRRGKRGRKKLLIALKDIFLKRDWAE